MLVFYWRCVLSRWIWQRKEQDENLLSAGVQHQPDPRGTPEHEWNLSWSPLRQGDGDLSPLVLQSLATGFWVWAGAGCWISWQSGSHQPRAVLRRRGQPESESVNTAARRRCTGLWGELGRAPGALTIVCTSVFVGILLQLVLMF